MGNIPESKKTMFSAVQPSGAVTLGNYLGAVKNWIDFQDEYRCIFSLADLHTITVRQDPEIFRQNTLELYALFLACGIDPERSVFFIQSQVPAHSELAWILNCYTQFGELSRMTQFKDKSQKHSDNINAGLFCYPTLMAADILLYDADVVPVGEDQTQHIELTRDIASRFNGIYGQTFKIPQAFVPKFGARVMSLQNPESKMSKSDPNVGGCIFLLDSPDTIMKKFKRAVTDSENVIKYSKDKPGISNLMNIYSALTGKDVHFIESEFENKGYGQFKSSVAESVIKQLKPIQAKFKDYLVNIDYIEQQYSIAREKATEISSKILDAVKGKVGFTKISTK